MIDFSPTIGHEQSGVRPAVILSVDKFNRGPAGLLVVAPFTSKNKRQPMHVQVSPPEGGLFMTSYIRCENIRSASKERLRQYLGAVSPRAIAEVEMRSRIHIGL